MDKKVIGIVSSRTKFKEEFRQGSYRSYVANDYIERVAEQGAIPIILPLIDDLDKIKEMSKLCDGFILSGGDDISPFLYGEEPNVYQGMIDDLRDKIDLVVIDEAIKSNKGVLGICRGMQAINIYYGGSLYQEITLKPEVCIAHVQKSEKNIPTHEINIEENSILFSIFGNVTKVNSYHHQCIKSIGKNIKVTAISNDGVIEGIEIINSRIFGVQWHPEMMDNSDEMKKLFKYFIQSLTVV